jgi:hypothetical protein
LPDQTDDDNSANLGDLVIPVYVDTNALLDLLAAIEDGFVMVERVSTSRRDSTGQSTELGGEFGIANVLNMLKIRMRGDRHKEKSAESTDQTDSDRTHTYGSLLHRLRNALEEAGRLRKPTSSAEAELLGFGDFVELRGIVGANPFTHGLRQALSLVELIETASPDLPEESTKTRSRSSGGRTTQSNSERQAEEKVAKADDEKREQRQAMKNGVALVRKMTEQVEREGTQTVVLDCTQISYKAVATLFTANLRDRSMSEIMNREFRILGKITRHLPPGDGDRVDLLTASGISALSEPIIDKLSETLPGVKPAEGNAESPVKIQRLISKIDPPVLEIVPIALYV